MGSLWPEICCVIFESPLGVFPDRAFFILRPLCLKIQVTPSTPYDAKGLMISDIKR